MLTDGGSAFPTAPTIYESGEVIKGTDGMSLRDWFAGQALCGICSNPNAIRENGLFSVTNLLTAYKMADKMLEQREKLNGK